MTFGSVLSSLLHLLICCHSVEVSGGTGDYCGLSFGPSILGREMKLSLYLSTDRKKQKK